MARGKLKRTGRSETVTAASPEAVWAIVADVTRVGEWSHECKEAGWLDGATGATPGARFEGHNRVGRIRWTRRNEVVRADAPHEFVWRTVSSWRFPDSTEWRIRLEPTAEGTRIVQTYEVLKINPVMERIIWLTTPPHRDRIPALGEDIQRLGELAAEARVNA